MKMQLGLTLGQHLTLTPQLQQAIRLLQLSTLELNQEIEELVKTNPLLEVESQETNPEPESSLSHDQPQTETHTTDISEDTTQWEEHYVGNESSLRQSNLDDDEMPALENLHAQPVTLQDHLRWQMELSSFSEQDRIIADILIDSIDESGFLQTSFDDIVETVKHETDDNTITIYSIETVLNRIQHFDPLGVGARNLAECLDIQLDAYDPNTPQLNLARQLIQFDLDALAFRQYKNLLRKYKTTELELQEAIQLIQSLCPRPGDLFSQGKSEYVIPDVIVRKIHQEWVVDLNSETIPKVNINQHYASMIKRADNSADNVFLKNHLQEARWFIKSLQSRHETLLRVATAIINHQTDFLEHGEEAMKPLILHDIAETLSLHESTVSRVTTQKYIHTPRGVFELKYFFSTGLGKGTGDDCSSTAIRAVIKKLVANEPANKPLSDHKMAAILQKQGIQVARRTIAKYREAMRIPPSNERKSLAQPAKET